MVGQGSVRRRLFPENNEKSRSVCGDLTSMDWSLDTCVRGYGLRYVGKQFRSSTDDEWMTIQRKGGLRSETGGVPI